MMVSVMLMPLCMLGGIGWFHVPVDIISAPATNICIGIAIDSMIHLVFGVRRAQRDGKKGWTAWVAAREAVSKPPSGSRRKLLRAHTPRFQSYSI